MKIIVAQNAGFCFGVKRAIEIVEKEANTTADSIYTLGEIIHNPQTVERMKNLGVIPINSLKEAEGKIVLPSHGATREIKEFLKERKINYADATCPYVTRIQKQIKSLSDRDYFIIMVGDKNHPEVRSSMSYCKKGKGKVIKDISEISGSEGDKVALLSQTTMSFEKFKEISEEIEKKFRDVLVINTICNATVERQREAKYLAETCSVVVVVGGRKSANTRRIKEISQKINPRTFHIENQDELFSIPFTNKDIIGIIGGASTPDWLIDKVVDVINKLTEEGNYGAREI